MSARGRAHSAFVKFITSDGSAPWFVPLSSPSQPKRPRGRPRKHPLPSPIMPIVCISVEEEPLPPAATSPSPSPQSQSPPPSPPTARRYLRLPMSRDEKRTASNRLTTLREQVRRRYSEGRAVWRQCESQIKNYDPMLFEAILAELEADCEHELVQLCKEDKNPNVLRYYEEVYAYNFAGREGLPE